jgi:uncharacterized protein (DUF1684 family)
VPTRLLLSSRALSAGLVGVALAAAAHAAPIADATWRDDLAAWRTRASEGLKRERGWLSITGRWELAPGVTKVGSAQGNDIVLPAELAPPSLATIEVRGGKAMLRLARGQSMQVVEKNVPGASFTERQVLPGDARIEWVTGGRLSLQFVKRDDGRFVLRSADREAPLAREFTGRAWYEPSLDFRIPARFVAQPKGTRIPIVNVRGEVSEEEVAGHLEFALDGKTVRLAALDDDGDLFVIFRDGTSGKTTYPPGRFISIKRPADGAWVVDFNRAYNPPCAFSAYTTCPLPPQENWLGAAVVAGERYVERASGEPRPK